MKKLIILLIIILGSCSPDDPTPECQCFKTIFRQYTTPFWYDENGTIHITPPNNYFRISEEEVECQDTYILPLGNYRFEQVSCINK
jgi:hypothetical protein